LSDDARLTSVAYIGPKSRTEGPRKTKIGTEVAHVTRDSDITFKVKGQLAGGGTDCDSLPHSLFMHQCSIPHTGRHISSCLNINYNHLTTIPRKYHKK